MGKALNMKTPLRTFVIYKDETVMLQAFFLPPNARIYLHEHPEMTVFSKVVHGTLRYMDCALDKKNTKVVENKKDPEVFKSETLYKILPSSDSFLSAPAWHLLNPET